MWYQHKLGNEQTHCATHLSCIHGIAASDGASMRAKELNISTALWAKWLEKDFSFTLLFTTASKTKCLCSHVTSGAFKLVTTDSLE